MKKFLLANVIAILVVFAIVATILVSGVTDRSSAAAGRINIYFNNDATAEGFAASYVNEMPLEVRLFERGENEDPATSTRRGRRIRMPQRNANFNLPGHTFLYWEDRTTTPATTFQDRAWVPAGITASRTFYAVWEIQSFNVDFQIDAVQNPPQFSIQWGQTIGDALAAVGRTLPTFATGTRPTHTFCGWFTDPRGRGHQITANTVWNFNNVRTLHGHWILNGQVCPPDQPAPNETVTVIFQGNGHTHGTPPVSLNITESQAQAMTSITVPSGFARTNHTLQGFYSAQTGGQRIFNANGTWTGNMVFVPNIPATINLWARWVENAPVLQNISVTFNANGGQFPGGGATRYATQVGNNTLTMPIPAPRTGFYFAGWRFNNMVVRNATELRVAAGNSTSITLIAQWLQHIDITYFANGGTFIGGGSVMYATVIGNANLTMPTPTRPNHDFLGWFFNPTTIIRNVTELRAASGTLNNVALVAHWRAR
ncbi:MAG: InlB B-repeat-containing protein [Firmicutes bacterium]|nr:InlB B-repeat-containing protein [Bacillota bacterium]